MSYQHALMCFCFLTFVSSVAISQERGQDSPNAPSSVVKESPEDADTSAAETDIRSKLVEAVMNGVVPLRVMKSENEKKIYEALDRPASVSFKDAALTECIRSIASQQNIQVVIDGRALEEIGLSVDVIEVTAELKDIALRNILTLVFREFDLTYQVQNEVLTITTIEAAEQNLVTNVYQLPGRLGDKVDRLIDIIQTAVVPDTWEVLGGPSTMTTLDDLLIVSTTTEVHYQVQELLGKLIEKYGPNPDVKAPSR